MIIMLSGVLTINGYNDDNIKIKKEGGNFAFNFNAWGFVSPFYVKVPNLFKSNGNYNFIRKDFAKKTWFMLQGYESKHIRIFKDCTIEDIEYFWVILWTKIGIITQNVRI